MLEIGSPNYVGIYFMKFVLKKESNFLTVDIRMSFARKQVKYLMNSKHIISNKMKPMQSTLSMSKDSGTVPMATLSVHYLVYFNSSDYGFFIHHGKDPSQLFNFLQFMMLQSKKEIWPIHVFLSLNRGVLIFCCSLEVKTTLGWLLEMCYYVGQVRYSDAIFDSKLLISI